jgi:hypothetical protein
MDFVHDRLFDGRKIRVLTIVDTFTRLSQIVRSKKSSDGAVVVAAQALLDRGWGKPTQPLAGDAEGPPINVGIGAFEQPVAAISRRQLLNGEDRGGAEEAQPPTAHWLNLGGEAAPEKLELVLSLSGLRLTPVPDVSPWWRRRLRTLATSWYLGKVAYLLYRRHGTGRRRSFRVAFRGNRNTVFC